MGSKKKIRFDEIEIFSYASQLNMYHVLILPFFRYNIWWILQEKFLKNIVGVTVTK